jgi:hypothetical protein
MHLVQVLLPLADNQGHPFADGLLREVREELVTRFGGVTAYGRAPAQGVWAHKGTRQKDDIAVVEVMVETLDVNWWAGFRSRLEYRLSQEELVVRAFEIRTF